MNEMLDEHKLNKQYAERYEMERLNKNKALALYKEHQEEYRFMSDARKRGYVRRLRNHAKRISSGRVLESQFVSKAVMALDIISTRLGITLTYMEE